MSRTYRKGIRWIEKYKGTFYDWHRTPHRSTQYPFHVTQYDDINLLDIGTARIRVEVKVSDSDNYQRFRGNTKDLKRMHHKIDRARYKQALRNNEDTHIVPSFDPWDWD
jgi:hypothetical protein